MRDLRRLGGVFQRGRGVIASLVLGGAVLLIGGCAGFVSGSNTAPGGTLTISNVAASSATPTTVTIGWQTNLAASSQVDYGTTVSYGSTTPLDPTMLTTHQVAISNLKPGTVYHCRVRSTDAKNNSVVSGDLACPTVSDTTPPTVSITSPAPNSTLSATVAVTANATDNVAVASVQFQVDGTNTGSAITSAPYSYSLNTTALADGNHVLTAVATDTSGNAATSAGVPVKVNNASPGPSISGLNPSSGLVGTSVTITGANFGATQGTSTVTFNGTTASPTGWSATSIVAPVPSGATTGNVVVTVGSVASNGVSFTVTIPGPSIGSLNPTSGLVGASVTITGTNFGATQGTSTVKFNGTTASPTSWSATSIVAPVPSGATTGNVVVIVGGVASNGVAFTVTTASSPSITSLNPTSGLVGTSVTITGANFGATQGTSTVTFSGTPATPTSWSATSIVAPVPSGATTGNVVVTVGGVASNSVSFTVTVPAPSISSLNPTSGSVGASVTITGTNFGATQGTSTVTFNGTAATPTSWSVTSIAVPVPSGATTGNVVVTVGGVTSNGVSFTVQGTGSATPALVGNGACPNSGTSGTPNWPTTPPFEYRCNTAEPTTAGNTLIVAFGTSGTGPYTVTDQQGDPFTLDITSPANNGRTLLVFRATNIAAGSTWISVRSSGRDNYWQPMVFEVDNAATLDASSCNSGTSTSITAGQLTPTVSGDLILQVSYAPAYNSPPGTTTSFAAGSQSSITWALAHTLLGDGSASQWGVYNSTSAINPTFTTGTSNPFVSCAVALQATATGGASTAFHVYHQEHDAMPKNAPNPWKVGVVVDVPGAVYLAYVGNDSINSVTSSPAPNVGWTASGADFNGLNGHNHVNFYCASWTSAPGFVTVDINRSATSNDSINMMYVVEKGTCNLDADSGGQAANQTSIVSQMTVCNGCLTPTAQNDLILSAGGQFDCTGTSLVAPASNAFFAAGWYNGNTVGGPQQVDENNLWAVIRNGSSLNPVTVTVGETCGSTVEGNWANRLAAYKTLP